MQLGFCISDLSCGISCSCLMQGEFTFLLVKQQFVFAVALHCSWHAIQSEHLTNVLNKWPTVGRLLPVECWWASCPRASDPGLARPLSPEENPLRLPPLSHEAPGRWLGPGHISKTAAEATGVRDHSRRQDARECLQFGKRSWWKWRMMVAEGKDAPVSLMQRDTVLEAKVHTRESRAQEI